MRLVSVSNEKELKAAGIPFKPSTLYAWKWAGKYKQIFRKIGGKLFVDVDEFERLVNNSKITAGGR